MVIEKKIMVIVWEGVEKPARFQTGGGSKCLGEGGGGPCAHRSPWVLGRIKAPSVMATKELLCILSQGPGGAVTSLGPGDWLSGSRLRLLLPLRGEGPLCQLSEWGQEPRAP